MAFIVEACGEEWGGSLINYQWVPAVSGSGNQTGMTDAEASTFGDEDEANTIMYELREHENERRSEYEERTGREVNDFVLFRVRWVG